MPQYLATFRNPQGKKVTERLEAESADEAVTQLQEQGCDEVVLHTDDVMALYPPPPEVAETFSPREVLRFRYLPSRVAIFVTVVLKIYQKNWIMHLIVLSVLLYRRRGEAPWVVLDTLLAAELALPLVWAFGSQLLLVSNGYHQLIEAGSWGRWEEVLARADGVGGKVAMEEIAFRKAMALAGLGRLDEAVRLVQPLNGGPKMPEWFYRSRLSEVFATAQRYEDAAAQMEQARQLAPDNATILLDIAKSEVWRRRNPRRARELLARARQHALSDVLRPFATYTEGLIHLEEGNPHDAWPLLKQAYREVYALRHATPLIGSILDQMHAALALTAAGMGDMKAARHHFQLARPRLEALRQDRVIARCEHAIGV